MSDEGLTASPTPPAAVPPRRRRGPGLLVHVAAVAGLLALLAYLHLRVVRVIYVTTGSMSPTIEPGDRLLVHLSAYGVAPPRRGDIVAFQDVTHGDYEVKRVIGVGGDEVIVGAGVVLLNGRRLDEPYIAEPMLREIPVGYRLEADQLFVMGDNRNGSEDSRDFGPIRRRQLMGRLFHRLLPLNRAGRLG